MSRIHCNFQENFKKSLDFTRNPENQKLPENKKCHKKSQNSPKIPRELLKSQESQEYFENLKNN